MTAQMRVLLVINGELFLSFLIKFLLVHISEYLQPVSLWRNRKKVLLVCSFHK